MAADSDFEVASLAQQCHEPRGYERVAVRNEHLYAGLLRRERLTV
jgi:hypothetical protein